MNTKILCAVYDKKAKIYDGYMIFDSEAQALRAFEQSCVENNVFKSWPDDFSFWRLGYIYKDSGELDYKHDKLAEAKTFVQLHQAKTEDKKA